jgi:hypothetical protein
MTLRIREDAGDGMRKHQISVCGDLALEEAVDLS